MIDVAPLAVDLKRPAAAIHPEGVVAADGARGPGRSVAPYRRRLARRRALDVPVGRDAEHGGQRQRFALGDRRCFFFAQREAVTELRGALKRRQRRRVIRTRQIRASAGGAWNLLGVHRGGRGDHEADRQRGARREPISIVDSHPDLLAALVNHGNRRLARKSSPPAPISARPGLPGSLRRSTAQAPSAAAGFAGDRRTAVPRRTRRT